MIEREQGKKNEDGRDEAPPEDGGGEKMLPIWFWIGSILTAYGLIVLGIGVFYLSHPQTKTVLAHTNPNLWWGGIMLATGAVFLVTSIRSMRAARK